MSEQDLVSATRLCFERGLRVEPAGAASLAAVMYGKVRRLFFFLAHTTVFLLCWMDNKRPPSS